MQNLAKNRKGLSAIFLSLYLAVLIFLFCTTLLIVTQVSSSAISERTSIEQDKEQERLLLLPGSLNLSANKLRSLEVNNTGAITVRLRAIYINNTFRGDPSEHQETYVNPQGSATLDLQFANLNLTNDILAANLTVTTERGTGHTARIRDLIFGPGGTSTDLVYGPIRLIWDMFHWSTNVPANDWYTGSWIPEAEAKKSPTWRILVQNVDKSRDIDISEYSCLTLTSPDQGVRTPFYINTNLSTTYLKPGDYALLFYSWPDPGKPGSVQWSTAKYSFPCFLVFVGDYVGPGPIVQRMGETIPFEAVFIA